jgi:hypothetical protein
MIFSQEVNQPARVEVLDHASVAMQKNYRGAGATFDVMQPDAAHLHELAPRRIVALGFLRKISIDQGGRG